MNAIWTQRGHYERRKKPRRRVGVNAPPHTRAKIGQGYPLRASKRHGDTATPSDKPEIEPTSDFLTRAEERADSNKKTRHEANHAATRPKRADERQERRRKDTARPPHQPTRAAADIRTPKDGKRTQPDGRRRREGGHSDTTRTRPHITNGGGYARTRAQRV